MRRREKMRRSRWLAGGVVIAAAGFFLGGVWSGVFSAAYGSVISGSLSFDREIPENSGPVRIPVEHVETPAAVKAVYMTQCAATAPSLKDVLIRLVEETELNAIVIDLKDYSGTVSFPSKTALHGTGCTVPEFRALVKDLHDRGIYAIGRLTVFQDPLYTKAHPEEAVQSIARKTPWKDHKGLSFVDVGSAPFHEYIIALAREAHDLGVDEINFDYIRYPSDGNMRDTTYLHSGPDHPDMLERFFEKLALRMRENQPDHVPVLSADLFGMTTTNEDDLNIGQVLERALPHFDYIAPMVYPSHYPKGFNGYQDVNASGYGIIHFSMNEAVRRAMATTTSVNARTHTRIGTSTPTLFAKPAYSPLKFRPWLQDFDYPVPYTPAMVEAQIKATYDAGLTSWMFWDPANRYDSLRKVLKPE